MDEATHMSDADLIQFTDREVHADAAAKIERHLNACADCRKRLNQLRSGAAAYEQYHQEILKPGLGSTANGWGAIRDWLPREKSEKRSLWFNPATLWAGVTLAGGLIVAILYFQGSSRPQATELLTEAVAVPESTRGPLLLTVGGHHWLRPAVFRAGDEAVAVPAIERSTFQHVHALFVAAHYSWEDPVSARSFAAWRYQLAQKQDQVTLIHGVDGKRRFYRVQTRTRAGILRTASLTLQADTYRATTAAFEFQGEDPVEFSEQPEAAEPARQQAEETPTEHTKLTETRAGPEDELRVFAALNAIGADAEEPIDVKLDAKREHVLVTGMGMPPERQKEVEKALAELPNTIVRFDSAVPDRNAAPSSEKSHTYTADSRSAFRQILEARAGGPRQLQAITDGALETSNALFAQAHSLLVLAHEFPPKVELGLSAPDRETLLGLRQRHVGAIEYAVRQLRDELTPLLEGEPGQGSTPQNPRNSSWQGSAEGLFEAARNLNELVSRLLAGSNAEQAGGEMLNELPSDLAKLEMLIRAQSAAEP